MVPLLYPREEFKFAFTPILGFENALCRETPSFFSAFRLHMISPERRVSFRTAFIYSLFLDVAHEEKKLALNLVFVRDSGSEIQGRRS